MIFHHADNVAPARKIKLLNLLYIIREGKYCSSHACFKRANISKRVILKIVVRICETEGMSLMLWLPRWAVTSHGKNDVLFVFMFSANRMLGQTNISLI